MPSLTPMQRYDLVTKAHQQLKDLGLAIIPVTSHQPWRVDCELVYKRYNELAETVRALAREVDWPGARPSDHP